MTASWSGNAEYFAARIVSLEEEVRVLQAKLNAAEHEAVMLRELVAAKDLTIVRLTKQYNGLVEQTNRLADERNKLDGL